MKAKNVRKHVGKEVVVKTPYDTVTNFNGQPLSYAEIEIISLGGLSILDGIVRSNGDVRLRNTLKNVLFVHHKFIKLVKKG